MDPNKNEKPQAPVSVGIGGRETGRLAQIEELLKGEGPELHPEVRKSGVEVITDHTQPAQIVPTPQIEVKEPLKQEATVPGSTLTSKEAKADLSADIFSTLRAAAIAFLRQFKRQLKIATSNP